MTKAKTQTKPIQVMVDIRPGPASPEQKTLYKRFLAKLMGKVKDELENER